MEHQPPKIGKFVLRYGALLGVISIIFGLMLYFMEMHLEQNPVVMSIGIVIMIVVILLGILDYKKQNSGFITLSQAVKVGVGTATIASVLIFIYQLLFGYVIEPDFASQVMELQREAMAEKNPSLSSEQINQQIAMSIKYFWMGYIVILLMNILIGLIISLIEGLIVKKSKPEY